MKKRIFIILIIFGILAIAFSIYVYGIPFVWKTHNIEDYGISFKSSRDFKSYKETSETNLLALYSSSKDYTINVTALGNGFWKSGDFNIINDQYIRLISASKYDYSFKNIKSEIVKIDGIDVGRVEMTIENPIQKNRVISILTNEEYNNIVLEFYGLPDVIEKNQKEIEKIIKSIKFSENKHPKSNKIKSFSGDVKSLESLLSSGDITLSGNKIVFNEIKSGE